MLEKENKDLQAFWDSFFEGAEPEAIEGKWIEDETFNSSIKKYVKEDSNVLDYGCGTGWALIEIARTVPFKNGIGIDTGANAIKYAAGCAEKSGDKNLAFITGDQTELQAYPEYFDVAVSFNVIDVLPDDITKEVLEAIKKSLKPGGVALIGINPDFPKDLLEKMGYTFKDGYMYKDEILRGNDKTLEQWESLLKEYFTLVETTTIALVDREKQYPRRFFILKK